MDQYIVTGMSCAACQARVEKAVSGVPGVDSCSVNLLTNSMGVEGTAAASDIIKAVTNAGYGARLKGAAAGGASGGSASNDGAATGSASTGSASTGGAPNGGAASGQSAPAAMRQVGDSLYAEEEEALRDHETPVLKRRLLTSIGFLAVLMYFSMGHGMWGWPVPAFFQDNPIGIALLEMILAVIVMIINKKFFISGFRSLAYRAPNMDTLVAMGSAVSFGWSTLVLFRMTRDMADGNMAAVMEGHHGQYFEAAAMIVTLITIGKMLEAMSKGKTTDALKSLMKLSPQTAVILEDDKEKEVPIGQVQVGDILS